MAAKILLIDGSLNQTTMPRRVPQHLGGDECHFTPYYADGVESLAAQMGLLDFTVRSVYLRDNLPVALWQSLRLNGIVIDREG